MTGKSSHQTDGDHFAGLDIGAVATKAVILDRGRKVVGSSVVASGADLRAAADKALLNSEQEAGLESPRFGGLVATGYGRKNVPGAAAAITEISCHAKGSFHHFPFAQTLIDIGGQDSKVIKIDAAGRRTGFKMNRKCAAGTGAFLEEIAHRLGLDPAWFDDLARRSTKDVEIGSYCTVFTASEILTKIRRNVELADIIKGVFASVIQRAMEMDPLEGEVVMSGGVVAHHPYLVEMFSARLGRKVHVPPHPQLTGALGAALYAGEVPGDGRA